MIRFQKADIAAIPTFKSYLASLSSPIDSFLEDHILDSESHRILLEDREVGCMAIHKNTLLTVFHVVGGARALGQRAFSQAVAHFNVRFAFVPTCDEFFLSHAVDAHTSLEKQAHFFIEGVEETEPSGVFRGVQYRPAGPTDVQAIVAMSGDFLDKPVEMVADGQVHVGHLDGDLVALGIVVQSRLFDRQASIGMFTRESVRRRGIGVSMIVHMRRLCRDRSVVPVAGCWYYNHESKACLEKAGMVTVTRLLKLGFGQDSKLARVSESPP